VTEQPEELRPRLAHLGAIEAQQLGDVQARREEPGPPRYDDRLAPRLTRLAKAGTQGLYQAGMERVHRGAGERELAHPAVVTDGDHGRVSHGCGRDPSRCGRVASVGRAQSSGDRRRAVAWPSFWPSPWRSISVAETGRLPARSASNAPAS